MYDKDATVPITIDLSGLEIMIGNRLLYLTGNQSDANFYLFNLIKNVIQDIIPRVVYGNDDVNEVVSDTYMSIFNNIINVIGADDELLRYMYLLIEVLDTQLSIYYLDNYKFEFRGTMSDSHMIDFTKSKQIYIVLITKD